MKEHVKIMTDSSLVIHRMAELLKAEEIPSLIKDKAESARLAGFGSAPFGVELYVYKSDAEKAQELIAKLT